MRKLLAHTFIFLAGSLACFCASGQEQPTSADNTLTWKHLPEQAGISIKPTTRLENLRFVYAVKGKLFVEIEGETERANKLLIKLFGDLGNVGWGDLLAPEQQAEVCKGLEIKGDESYVVILPGSGSASLLKLTGLASYYEGGGGRNGFWGALPGEAPHPRTEFDDWCDVVGVAYRSDEKPKAESVPVKTLGDDECEILRAEIAKECKEPVSVLEAVRLPQSPVVFASARVGKSDYLFPFDKRKDTLRPLQVNKIAQNGVLRNALALEERPGGFCGAMSHSRVWFLPDVNGDGVQEILVASTESFIFDPAPGLKADGSAMRLINHTYFGP